MLTRRFFIASSLVLPVAGCSSSQMQTITVTLLTVQAEVKAINSAVDAVYKSLPPATQAPLAKYISVLDAAAAATAALTPSSNYQTVLESVIAASQAAIEFVPLPAPTITAIQLGLGLVSALIAGLPTVTVPASAAAQPSLGVKATINAPIPIPLS